MEKKSPIPGSFSPYFVVVVSIFVTCLIVSNIIAAKLIVLYGVLLPAAIILFPISYILGDVMTEVYGYGAARRMIWLGFLCNFIATGAIAAAQALPFPDFWDGQAAFERILGQNPRIVLASLTAYLVGEFVNSYMMARIKVAMKGKHLWVRTLSSSVVGEGIDSLAFIAIAFAGSVPGEILISMIATQWLVKLAYETAATPLTYALVYFLKRREGIDIYDQDIKFNPFALSK